MRILITTELREELFDRLRLAAPGADFVVATEPAEWDREYQKADIVFGRGATPERLSAARSLQWIQVWSAGVDRYMFPEFVESEIILTNVRGMHGHTIADHVFMFLLVFSRNFQHYYKHQLAGEWERGSSAEELAETTLGIVGLGGIGTEIARRGQAFGQRVVAVKRHPEPHPLADQVFGSEELPRLLAMSDYVVVSCPLTDETHHMFGPEQFEQMKNSAVIVNIGRGPVIDEDALISALQNGELAGAGLDVFEEEPLPKESPLWDMDNVLITPHMSGSQRDYMKHAISIFADNLERFQAGQPLRNVVDRKLGY